MIMVIISSCFINIKKSGWERLTAILDQSQLGGLAALSAEERNVRMSAQDQRGLLAAAVKHNHPDIVFKAPSKATLTTLAESEKTLSSVTKEVRTLLGKPLAALNAKRKAAGLKELPKGG